MRAILGAHPSVQAVAHERHVLGLDRPLLVRYWDWLSGAVHGDFGTSLVYKTSVGSLISPRIGTTLLLVGYSLVIILMIGLTLGISAARSGASARLSQLSPGCWWRFLLLSLHSSS